MKKILVCGSLAYDYIMNFDGRFADHILPDKIHRINVSFTAQKLTQQYGGTGGNIAFNLALLNEHPVLIAAAGTDFVRYQRWLESNKIDTSEVRVIEEDYTASAHIMTDKDDNQITAFHGGAMLCNDRSIGDFIQSEKADDIALGIISADCPAGMVLRSKELAERQIPFFFDPGQSLPAHTGTDLQNMVVRSMGVFVNDYELQLLMEKTGWGMDELLEQVEYVVVTFGPKGSKIFTKKKVYDIPTATPENDSDPTGAGDAYRAGFLKGILRGWSVENAAKAGAVTSVYTVEMYGTQTHLFDKKEFLARFEANFGKLSEDWL